MEWETHFGFEGLTDGKNGKFGNGRRSFFEQLFTAKTELHKSFYIISLLELKQYIFFCFVTKRSPTVVSKILYHFHTLVISGQFSHNQRCFAIRPV